MREADSPLAFDVVVVGSGTGLLAAVAAGELGLRVLVAEKSEYLGGSTAMSGGGFWVPGNSVLKDLGVPDSRDRAGAYLDALVGDRAPRERRESFLDHGPAAVEVLRRNTPNSWQHMREYPDYFPEVEGGSPFGRAVEPKPFNLRLLGEYRTQLRPPGLASPIPMPVTGRDYRWMNLAARTPLGALTVARRLGQGVGGLALRREYAAGGQALVAGLILAARRQGVTLWTEAPLRDLMLDSGRVVGAVVERRGRPVTVRVERGVILSAGGVDRNAEMRHQYQFAVVDGEWSLGNPADAGEVIRIAEAHGAALAFMDQAWWFPAIPPAKAGGYPGILLAERSLPGSIMVDGSGRRFMNEAVNYMTAGQIMLGQDDDLPPHLPAWIIFDQAFRNRYLFGAVVMPRMPLPKTWYEAGLAHRAATVAALGQQTDLPGLVVTVERFNLMAAQGHDDDFGRGNSMYDRYYGDPAITPNPNLAPLLKPPFYAVKVVPGDLGTCGGIQAVEYARATRPDGSVIDGLYAIGNCAGNVFGSYYPGPGATIGQGLVFGYIAAVHAAGKLT